MFNRTYTWKIEDVIRHAKAPEGWSTTDENYIGTEIEKYINEFYPDARHSIDHQCYSRIIFINV